MNNFIIYIFRGSNRNVSTNIAENCVGIFVSKCLLCLNVIITSFDPKLNVRFYEQRYDLYIYSVLNKIISMNMANNHVNIFINYC